MGVIAFNGTGKDRVIGIEIGGADQVRQPVRAGELLTVRIAG